MQAIEQVNKSIWVDPSGVTLDCILCVSRSVSLHPGYADTALAITEWTSRCLTRVRLMGYRNPR